MKLAEALMIRSDYQVKIDKLERRLMDNIKIQEGEAVTEDPNELLEELYQTIERLNTVVQQINNTNNLSKLDDGMTLSNALSSRESISKKRGILESLVRSASIKQSRVSRSEIKFVTTIDVKTLQKEIDTLSKHYRMLDTRIKSHNWLVDLIE